MTDPTAAFAKMVPGFDFLQGLVKNAGAAMPNMGQWVAPTLDPEELDKRINDLRTVQFWLEQNARLLGATIQALEVQRMTLSTLKTMNVSFGDLTESLKIRMPERAPKPEPEPEVEEEAPPAPAPRQPRASDAAAPATPSVPNGVVDPMQWWGALTQQFTQLAANAMKDGTGDAAKHLAGTMVQQGLDAAGETFKKAAGMPAAVVKGAAAAAQKMAGAAVKAGTRTAAKPTANPRAAAKRGAGKAR
jgi:hypothetical protein